GSVTDFNNSSPINGATVNAKDMESGEIKATTNTGSNGRYFFNNLPPGIYLIEAHTDSHRPEQKVSVIKTKDTVNFVLHQ
ncbi:MAG: carboxypeptidase-like regulatory domain-containing protein, partial [Desulfotomaculaceae bacterium]